MTTANSFAPEANIDLRSIWDVIVKHKWAIVILPIVVALLVKFAVGYITPTYRATATVLIEATDPNLVSIEEVYAQQRRTAQYFDTQFAILKSRPLAEKVVSDLEIVKHPEYRPEPPSVAFYEAWMGIEPEPSSLDPETRAVLRYMDRLSIRPVPRTQLVNVAFESEDPRLASKVANAHAQAYIEGTMEARLGMTETAISWMSNKLDDLQAKLSESERALQDYREEHGVIDYDGLKALPSQEINDLTGSLADARQDVSAARAAYLQAFPGGGDQIAANLEGVPAVQEDPLSQEFRRALNDAQAEVDELSKRLGPSHPQMVDAQAALTRARDNLELQHRRVAERIRNEYSEARAKEAEIALSLEGAKARFQAVGRTEADFRALERDVQTNRELYDMFYSRIKETAQTGDLQQAEARILSPAVRPIRPVAPDEDMIVGVAFVGSLVLTLVAVFLVEALNDRITVGNGESRLGLSMLSMIPYVGNRRKYGETANLFRTGSHRAFKESIRTLRTSVSLTNQEELTKVILVTSSLGDEGKTTVAVNLANAFSQMEKVLLIDGDLRMPSVARRMNLSMDSVGFAELLAETAKLDECITTVEENLDVMTAGHIPEDALQLLSARHIANLMRVLRIKYDRIIFDSPPTLPVSDTPVLSSHADAVVLVTKSKSTRFMQARATIAKLQRVSAPLIGFVVNQWDMKDHGGYGVYSYYGYGSDDDVAVRKAAS